MTMSYAARRVVGFIALTGHYPRYVQVKTRLQVTTDHLLLNSVETHVTTGRMYTVTEAGMEEARRDRMYKAAQFLLGQGYVIDGRPFRSTFISFRNPEVDRPWQNTFVTDSGSVYVDGKPVASFKNGK